MIHWKCLCSILAALRLAAGRSRSEQCSSLHQVSPRGGSHSALQQICIHPIFDRSCVELHGADWVRHWNGIKNPLNSQTNLCRLNKMRQVQCCASETLPMGCEGWNKTVLDMWCYRQVYGRFNSLGCWYFRAMTFALVFNLQKSQWVKGPKSQAWPK